MAVTFRSKSQVVATATGNSTLTEPASTALNDMLISLAAAEAGTSLTRPSLWQLMYSGTQGAFMYDVSRISRGASAPNLTWGVSGTSKYREIHLLCLTAGGALVLFDASATGTAGNRNSATIDPPAVTAVAASSLSVSGGVQWNGIGGSGNMTPSTGYTIRTQNLAGDDAGMQTKSLVAAGVENPATMGGFQVGAADYWDGFTATFTDIPAFLAAQPLMVRQAIQRAASW